MESPQCLTSKIMRHHFPFLCIFLSIPFGRVIRFDQKGFIHILPDQLFKRTKLLPDLGWALHEVSIPPYASTPKNLCVRVGDDRNRLADSSIKKRRGVCAPNSSSNEGYKVSGWTWGYRSFVLRVQPDSSVHWRQGFAPSSLSQATRDELGVVTLLIRTRQYGWRSKLWYLGSFASATPTWKSREIIPYYASYTLNKSGWSTA